MKYKCVKNCFIEHNGLVQRFNTGQVIEADKCPTHFVGIEDSKVNFLTSGKDELLNTKWSLAEAKEAVKAAYGVTLTGKKKETLVKQILDARERATAPEGLPPKAA